MSLSIFIRDHHEEIISEFAVLAKTLMPAGTEMTEVELRDHADEILTAVVQDIGGRQTSDEQSDKSRGHGSAAAALRRRCCCTLPECSTQRSTRLRSDVV
jgi:hypothetical protein